MFFPHINDDNWVVFLEISKAYFHIPIADSAIKYLSFVIKRKKYKFLAMIFCLAFAPYNFY